MNESVCTAARRASRLITINGYDITIKMNKNSEPFVG